MKSVSSRWSRSSTGKFTLFLDFLAEYCGDMDYEPLDWERQEVNRKMKKKLNSSSVKGRILRKIEYYKENA